MFPFHGPKSILLMIMLLKLTYCWYPIQIHQNYYFYPCSTWTELYSGQHINILWNVGLQRFLDFSNASNVFQYWVGCEKVIIETIGSKYFKMISYQTFSSTNCKKWSVICAVDFQMICMLWPASGNFSPISHLMSVIILITPQWLMQAI